MKRRADKAGHLRFGLPKALGGKDGSNLAMALIREHLAHKGLGLHNDLQNESSIVGNFPVALLLRCFVEVCGRAFWLRVCCRVLRVLLRARARAREGERRAVCPLPHQVAARSNRPPLPLPHTHTHTHTTPHTS